MTPDSSFWIEIAQLARINPIVIVRPRGSVHPRYPEAVYPLDYGYFENITAGDGDGIDVWLGSLEIKTLTGILCTFDTLNAMWKSKSCLVARTTISNSSKNFTGKCTTFTSQTRRSIHEFS